MHLGKLCQMKMDNINMGILRKMTMSSFYSYEFELTAVYPFHAPMFKQMINIGSRLVQ